MVMTVEQFAKRMATAPARVETEMRKAVTLAGQVLGQSARRKLPQSGQLRNVGRGGAPIGVKVLPTVGHRRPTSLITATGPLWLLDNRTKAHTIRARSSRTLALPDGGRPTTVRHPGTAGRHGFDKGIVEGLPLAKSLIAEAFSHAGRLI